MSSSRMVQLGDVGPAPEARVHRDEVVPPVDLEAVAGVVEERDVGGLGGLEEAADERGHLGLGEVGAAHHLKPSDSSESAMSEASLTGFCSGSRLA